MSKRSEIDESLWAGVGEFVSDPDAVALLVGEVHAIRVHVGCWDCGERVSLAFGEFSRHAHEAHAAGRRVVQFSCCVVVS